jgi:hypothetical protein
MERLKKHKNFTIFDTSVEILAGYLRNAYLYGYRNTKVFGGCNFAYITY